MSATFQNLGFETAGTAPGLASGWTLVVQASAEEIAAYGTTGQPVEDFEGGWHGNDTFTFSFAPTAIVPTLFDADPESVEDFEEGWSQDEFPLLDFDQRSSDLAAYNSEGTKLFEDFEDHFAGNESFLFAFVDGNLTIGPIDGFESGWRGNQAFLFAFGDSNLSVGPTESFELGWTTNMTTV